MATNEKAQAIGNFYKAADDYTAKFKIGGKQKLQKIIGSDLIFKRGDSWIWGNQKIIKMSVSELEKLIKKIKNA